MIRQKAVNGLLLGGKELGDQTVWGLEFGGSLNEKSREFSKNEGFQPF